MQFNHNYIQNMPTIIYIIPICRHALSAHRQVYIYIYIYIYMPSEITSLDKCTKEDPAKLKCNYSSFHYYMFIKKCKPKNRDVKLL